MVRLVIAALSFALGAFVYAVASDVDTKRADARVYGDALTEKPWHPMACFKISQQIHMILFLKSIGARKPLVFAEIEKNTPDDGDRGEFIRELSEAWDKGTDPAEWARECVARGERLRNQPPTTKS